MGGTVSKAAKQIGLDDLRKLATLEDDVTDSCHSGDNKRKSNGIWRRNRGSVGCINNEKHVSESRQTTEKNTKLQKKNKKQHSVSVKKRNVRYKKVTKSIIGRPTNFQHTGHIGATHSWMMETKPEITALPENKDMLSTQLLGITALLNASSSNDQHHDQQQQRIASRTPRRARSNKTKTNRTAVLPSSPRSSLPPPIPPPHRNIPRSNGHNAVATAAPPSAAAYPKVPPLHSNGRSSFRKRQCQQQQRQRKPVHKRSIGPRSRVYDSGMPPSLRPAPAR